MRVTVSHDKGLDGIVRSVNDQSDQLLKQVAASGGPMQVTDVVRQWNGNVMHYEFIGRVGIFSAPIKGDVICGEKEVTIDIELPGMVKNFLPEDKLRAQVESRVKGLLT
jgi:hypothetical protein